MDDQRIRSAGHAKKEGLIRRQPLVSFFVLTYVLSWGVGALLAGVPLIAPDRLFGAGPLVAALIITGLVSGRDGLRNLGRRLLQWRVGLRWYAAVLALPIILVGTAVVLIPVIGGTALDWTQRPGLAPTAVFLVGLACAPLATPVGEEIGWRGFALPRLLARRPVTDAKGQGGGRLPCPDYAASCYGASTWRSPKS